LHARAFTACTDGAFDPTIRDALERAGYDVTFDHVARDAPEPVTTPEPAPGIARVGFDADRRALRVPSDVRVDLGGLGKGLAADCLATGLVDRGARSALCSLGGDMRAAGTAPNGGWRIPVEHPLDDKRVAFEYELHEGAIVTSTTRLRTWTRAGVRHHHLIDPRTGRPAASCWRTVTVAAASCLHANVASTAAVILSHDAPAWLEQRALDARLVATDGRMLSTCRWPAAERLQV
jgi:thiamine biosynthesis lipoprotein